MGDRPGIFNLVLRPPDVQPRPASRNQAAAPRHRRGETFLKGPIPWDWLAVAGAAGGRALHVAVALWLEAGMRRNAGEVHLSHKRLREMGVDRHAARRGLQELERVGLVAVKRRNGAAPVVTLLNGAAPGAPTAAPASGAAG